MKEQFDKRLVEKIRDSFAEYEEPFDPQEWDKFSQVYFNKPTKKRWAVWPYLASGIAAAVILALVFFPYEKEIEQGVSTFKGTIANKSKDIEELLKAPIDSSKEDTGPQLAEAKPVIQSSNSTEIMAVPETLSIQPRTDSDALESLPRMDTYDEAMIADYLGEVAILGQSPSSKAAPGQVNRQSLATNQSVKSSMMASEQAVMDEQQAKEYLDQWKGDTGTGAEKNTASIMNQSDKSEDMPFRLGIIGGPQTVANSESGMQFNGGLVSEFSFSKRLKLDVGVTYAQQQNIHSDSPAELPESMTVRSDFNSLGVGFTNNYLGSDYTFRYSSLDIPINLKYKLVDKSRADFFLITGLSSMIYLNQTGTETFSVDSRFSTSATGSLISAQSVQTYSEEYKPEDGQSNVDLGKMLNLSFGYEYSLTNGTFLSIEPYYKLPLGNMTFTNQQFSVGGVNLRMNFQFKK